MQKKCILIEIYLLLNYFKKIYKRMIIKLNNFVILCYTVYVADTKLAYMQDLRTKNNY